MIRQRTGIWLCWIAALIGQLTSFADEEVIHREFCFRVPNGWRVLTSEADERIARERKEISSTQPIDWSKITYFVFRDDGRGFSAVLMVAITGDRIPTTEANRLQHHDTIITDLAESGVKLHDLVSKIDRFGDNRALVFESVTSTGEDGKSRQRVVFFDGSPSLIVTCVASAADWETFSGAFDMMLSSFEIRQPPAPIDDALFGIPVRYLVRLFGCAVIVYAAKYGFRYLTGRDLFRKRRKRGDPRWSD